MRFANHRSLACYACYSRSFAWMLCLLLFGCGVNEVSTSAEAQYYPLPPAYHIKDEYFVAVHPESKHPSLGSTGMEVVNAALQEMYGSGPITGCGGSIDPAPYKYDAENLFCVRLPNSDANLRALLANNQVLYVEAHGRVVLTGIQVCPPWGLDQIDEAIFSSGNGIYSYSRTGKKIDIYLLDSGVNRVTGEFLLGNNGYDAKTRTPIAVGTDSDDVGHGTLMAGIIASKSAGVAKESIIHPIKVFDKTGPLSGPNILADANTVKIATAKLISTYCSKGLGGELAPKIAVLPFTTELAASPTLAKEVRSLVDCGFVVVVSAGNLGKRAEEYSPSFEPQSITVGFYNRYGAFDPRSNFGKSVDILAPGDSMPSVSSTGKGILSGSSAAAAMVAGVAAQILEDRQGIVFDATLTPNAFVTDRLLQDANEAKDMIVPSGTTKRVLRTLYASGRTGDIHESLALDISKDALSITQCNNRKYCNLLQYCSIENGNPCNQGLKDLSGAVNKKCGHGIDCSSGLCKSCGLKDEICCDGASHDDARCGESLFCNQFNQCVCGGLGEVCCKGTSCGNGRLACDGVDRKCKVCGLQAGQPCCSDGCQGDNLVCGKDSKCEACGGDGLRCCAGLKCSGGPAGHLQCLRTPSDPMDPAKMTCQACGQPGLPCCGTPRDPCDRGSVCGADPMDATKKICRTCSGRGEPCCTSSPACAGSLQCLPNPNPMEPNSCQACGQPGLPCCGTPRDPCDRGSVCGADPMDATKKICRTCSGRGEPCCTSSPACAGSLQCLPNPNPMEPNSCQACGQPGLPCCGTPRDPCERGTVCNSDRKCQSCGGPNEPCCRSGGACIDVNHTCQFGKCGEWKTCSIRCKNGEEMFLGLQPTAAICSDEGVSKCKACGSTNDLARSRFDGLLSSENSAHCGRTGQACCASETSPHDEKQADWCKKEIDLDCAPSTNHCPALTTKQAYTCKKKVKP
jgi:hypothetical protein